MDWIRFAALVDEWPHAYEAFDCSLLDPADEDERRIGLAAAHPELHDALDDDDLAHLGDTEVNPNLHLVAHEIVANQLINGDPPEARETAERLLAAGYDGHEVLHMLGSVAMEHVHMALLTGETVDKDEYLDALDALPESWHDLEPDAHFLDDDYALPFTHLRDRIEALLLEEGPADVKALAQRLDPAGDVDPQQLALYLRWHEDFAHVLVDGRVAHEAKALDGFVLLHRTTPIELELERLDMSDLHLLLSIPDSHDGVPLAGGGLAQWHIRLAFDGPPTGPDDESGGVWTLDGPPGWLHSVRAAEVVAVSWREGVLRVEPSAIDDLAAARAAPAIADAFAARADGDPDLSPFDVGACEVEEILLDVLVAQPESLRRPTAPLQDLISRAGLALRGDWVAPGDYDWDEHDGRRHARFVDIAIREAGVDREDVESAYRLIEQIEGWLHDKPDDGRALVRAGELLLVPGMPTAVFNADGRYDNDDKVTALLEVAQRIVDAQSGRADGGAHFLVSQCADRLGDGVRADRHLRAALAGGLDDVDLFDMASTYLFIGGDLARAAHLRDLAELDDEYDNDVVAVLAPFLQRASRNDQCPCGSGRKHKHCHGTPSGPPRSSEERAELVHLKAATLLERIRGIWMSPVLQRLGADRDDGDDPTPLQLRLATDLALFEGGGLTRVRARWGPLFPPDEQRLVDAWLGTPIAVTDRVVTRHLPVDAATWQPWEFPLENADRAELTTTLEGADHLASAEALAALLR